MTEIKEIIEKFEHNLLSVNRLSAQSTIMEACKNFDKTDVPDKIIAPVLESIGQQWESGKVALSQVYMSGVICEELINTLYPHKDLSANKSSLIAIATYEDHHALGKRIVLSILRAGGFDVLDYGHGVQADDIVQKIKADGVRILLISTLMFPSARHILTLREKLDSAGLNVKIAVGGAPFRFDENLWKEVGADAMGRTASEAVQITRKMMEEIS